jgi:N-methylhydantoinase B
MLSAMPPDGAVFLYWEASNTLVSAIFRALAPVLGEAAIAGDVASCNVHNANGVLEDGSPWLSASQCGGEHGPWGATGAGDGESYLGVYGSNGLDPAIESIEAELPLLMTRREPVVDSVGAGVNRGGAAVLKDSLWLRDAEHYSMPLRFKVPSGFGVHGGGDGEAGGVWIWPGGDDATAQIGTETEVYGEAIPVAGRFDPATGARSAEGDYVYFAREGSWVTKPMATFRYITNGGGGWGDPFERDADRVLRDVRNGYVSVEAARRDYGVAVLGDPDRDPEGLRVDAGATRTLRGRDG